MNSTKTNNTTNHTHHHLIRVGNRLFDKDWNEVKTYTHNGWRYVKIGGRQIGVSSFPSKEGYNEPVYYNYVFGNDFDVKAAWYYTILLSK